MSECVCVCAYALNIKSKCMCIYIKPSYKYSVHVESDVHVHLTDVVLYFRSLVFSELLFPWIQDLPNQLVLLGESSPKTSGFIISSISLAATHSPLGMEEILQTTIHSVFSEL